MTAMGEKDKSNLNVLSLTVSFLQTNGENVEESEGGKKYSFV
jgi:hypothetical protein